MPDPDSAIIEDTYFSFRNMLESDKEAVVGTLDSMERANHNATSKFMNIADATAGLDHDREFLDKVNRDIDKYVFKIGEIDSQSRELEALVKEIDEWSKELEIKARRVKNSSR